MLVLNLADQENSYLKYKKGKYPDSQVYTEVAPNGWDHYHGEDVVVKARMNSYEDLALISGAVSGLKNLGATNLHLEVPCFFAQRSDRPFSEGWSFDLGEICKQVAAMGFNSVTLLHPHSDVLPACLRVLGTRVIVKDNMSLVRFALKHMLPNEETSKLKSFKDLVLVSPDAGAYKQVCKIADALNLPLVPGNKYRIPGTSDLHLEIHGDVKDKVCLIIDDYCDGGKTFINLAQKLKDQGAKSVFLCVTHGLFSAGLEPLFKALEGIYTTNSIRDIVEDQYNLEQMKVI